MSLYFNRVLNLSRKLNALQSSMRNYNRTSSIQFVRYFGDKDDSNDETVSTAHSTIGSSKPSRLLPAVEQLKTNKPATAHSLSEYALRKVMGELSPTNRSKKVNQGLDESTPRPDFSPNLEDRVHRYLCSVMGSRKFPDLAATLEMLNCNGPVEIVAARVSRERIVVIWEPPLSVSWLATSGADHEMVVDEIERALNRTGGRLKGMVSKHLKAKRARTIVFERNKDQMNNAARSILFET